MNENESRNSLRLRNWLNIIFMIGAIVGVICWYAVNRDTGLIIILASIVVKFIESTIRLLKI